MKKIKFIFKLPEHFCYILLIFSICLSAASCLAVREKENSDAATNSSEKTSDSKNLKEENKSSDQPEDNNFNESKQKTLAGKQNNSSELVAKDGFQTRCGWYSNPTPGNHWLTDADGEWIIGVQGGHQAVGDYPPEFGRSQWIATNGYYGYGCACLSVKVDKKERLILEIADGKARALSVCQNDPKLKNPE